jgi:hypothetical protein
MGSNTGRHSGTPSTAQLLSFRHKSQGLLLFQRKHVRSSLTSLYNINPRTSCKRSHNNDYQRSESSPHRQHYDTAVIRHTQLTWTTAHQYGIPYSSHGTSREERNLHPHVRSRSNFHSSTVLTLDDGHIVRNMQCV